MMKTTMLILAASVVPAHAKESSENGGFYVESETETRIGDKSDTKLRNKKRHDEKYHKTKHNKKRHDEKYHKTKHYEKKYSGHGHKGDQCQQYGDRITELNKKLQEDIEKLREKLEEDIEQLNNRLEKTDCCPLPSEVFDKNTSACTCEMGFEPSTEANAPPCVEKVALAALAEANQACKAGTNGANVEQNDDSTCVKFADQEDCETCMGEGTRVCWIQSGFGFNLNYESWLSYLAAVPSFVFVLSENEFSDQSKVRFIFCSAN